MRIEDEIIKEKILTYFWKMKSEQKKISGSRNKGLDNSSYLSLRPNTKLGQILKYT